MRLQSFGSNNLQRPPETPPSKLQSYRRSGTLQHQHPGSKLHTFTSSYTWSKNFCCWVPFARYRTNVCASLLCMDKILGFDSFASKSSPQPHTCICECLYLTLPLVRPMFIAADKLRSPLAPSEFQVSVASSALHRLFSMFVQTWRIHKCTPCPTGSSVVLFCRRWQVQIDSSISKPLRKIPVQLCNPLML